MEKDIDEQAKHDLIYRLKKHAAEIDRMSEEEEEWIGEEWALDIRCAVRVIETLKSDD